MLYRFVKERRLVAVLALRRNLVHHPDAIITDENAACGTAAFRPALIGLDELDRTEVFRHNWHDPDPVVKERMRRKTMAELLVPECITPDNVQGAWVPDANVEKELRHLVTEERLKIKLRPDLFFDLKS